MTAALDDPIDYKWSRLLSLSVVYQYYAMFEMNRKSESCFAMIFCSRLLLCEIQSCCTVRRDSGTSL